VGSFHRNQTRVRGTHRPCCKVFKALQPSSSSRADRYPNTRMQRICKFLPETLRQRGNSNVTNLVLDTTKLIKMRPHENSQQSSDSTQELKLRSDAIISPKHAAVASMMKSLTRACRPGTNSCAISMKPENARSKMASKSCLCL